MSCFSWMLPSQKSNTASKVAPESFVSQKVVEDDSWRAANELSVASTACVSSKCLDEDLFSPESEDDTDTELPLQPEPRRVELQDEHLFFMGASHSIEEVVRVGALAESPTAGLRLFAKGQALEAGTEHLLVDCRATPQDDPKLTKLIGARLCEGGRTSRLLIREGVAAAAPSVLCEIVSTPCGAEGVRTVSLAEAIAAVREARQKLDEAADLRRQRELNARLLGQRRKRALGLV